ncbi:hypothetical protein EYF80_008659 [Liparis tanakae]|uniref:Uncharacterized protein n=1 Tax=Liparis tanakae TaxID=230148 RepID=A0A4Z2IUV4_9TELE|nr:hypothetical protein EYF80_008659 [Liparis tanakae]
MQIQRPIPERKEQKAQLVWRGTTLAEENIMLTLSGGPGTPICEGLSLPFATNIALIFAATAAAASRAPVGAASASPRPPGPGPGWSHLLRRLGGQKDMAARGDELHSPNNTCRSLRL